MDTGFDKKHGKISIFLRPISIGPGMLWKKSDNLSVNFFSCYVKANLGTQSLYWFGPSFGVLQGDSSDLNLEPAFQYYKFIIMANVSIENRLNLYSNYLDDPQNVDIDYQMNVVMRINKYLTANVALQTIYDDNSVQAVK
jgi:hypothetical protein